MLKCHHFTCLFLMLLRTAQHSLHISIKVKVKVNTVVIHFCKTKQNTNTLYENTYTQEKEKNRLQNLLGLIQHLVINVSK